MKVVRRLFFLLCATSLSVTGQQAPAPEGTAAAIRALEYEWVVGQSRNDNHALNLIFDNALVYVEYGRLVTKGEYLSRIRVSGPQLSQIVLDPMTVHTFGRTTAVVVGAYREREGKGSASGPKRWRFVDTWVYKKNGWVLVSAAAAPVSK